MNGKKIGALATAAAILLTGCGSNGDGSADDKSSDQVASSPKAGGAGGEVGAGGQPAGRDRPGEGARHSQHTPARFGHGVTPPPEVR